MSPNIIQNSVFSPARCLSAALFDGADAETFLQGQLTADVRALPDGEWRRAAYCTPQGRALATMLFARRGGGFVAVLPADVAESLAARLARFVLRAKVNIQILPGAVGVCVAPDDSPPQFLGGAVREENGAQVFDEGGGVRLCVCAENSETKGGGEDGDGGKDGGAAWRREQILRGIPWIGAAAGDILVPQYFNWDVLGGVSFRKGCYAGQEIIARLHYLGNVKRRGYILRGEGAPPPDGAKIGADGFSCQVVNAAADGENFAAFVAAPRAENGAEVRWEDRTARLLEPPYGLPSAAEDQKPKPKI